MSLDDLYKEVILDHYQNPRNRGQLDNPDVATRGHNPLCGDEVILGVKLNGDRIDDIAFSGRGCSISQASASMMTESIKGKSLDEAVQVLGIFKTMMTDKNAPDVDEGELGDLEALQGVKRYPVRIKCAILPWNVLKEGLDLYQSRSGSATATGATEK